MLLYLQSDLFWSDLFYFVFCHHELLKQMLVINHACFSVTPNSSCCVCSILVDGKGNVKCGLCKKICHMEAECSVPDVSLIKNGRANEAKRVCRKCICKRCKMPKRDDHACVCVWCQKPTYDSEVCFNCCQPIHTVACALDEGSGSFMCLKCEQNKGEHIVTYFAMLKYSPILMKYILINFQLKMCVLCTWQLFNHMKC